MAFGDILLLPRSMTLGRFSVTVAQMDCGNGFEHPLLLPLSRNLPEAPAMVDILIVSG